MRFRRRFSLSTFVNRLSLFVVALAFLVLPGNASADSMVLVRIVDSIDLAKLSQELKDMELSAAIKMNKNGDLVVKCLNSFSLPIARQAFEDNPGMQKLMQRTTLQVEQKGSGVMVKLALLF